MSASALPEAPHVLTVMLQRRWNAPLPPTYESKLTRSFGDVLEPR